MNPRPFGYEPNELPDCSTPHQTWSRGSRSLPELFRASDHPIPGIKFGRRLRLDRPDASPESVVLRSLGGLLPKPVFVAGGANGGETVADRNALDQRLRLRKQGGGVLLPRPHRAPLEALRPPDVAPSKELRCR